MIDTKHFKSEKKISKANLLISHRNLTELKPSNTRSAKQRLLSWSIPIYNVVKCALIDIHLYHGERHRLLGASSYRVRDNICFLNGKWTVTTHCTMMYI